VFILKTTPIIVKGIENIATLRQVASFLKPSDIFWVGAVTPFRKVFVVVKEALGDLARRHALALAKREFPIASPRRSMLRPMINRATVFQRELFDRGGAAP